MPDDSPSPGTPTTEALEPSGKRRAALHAGKVIAKRYRLDEHLGEGGMGSVWIGWDQQLERKVAVKFMSAHAIESGMLRARFDREAKAAARLRTKHVVEVHDFGIDLGAPYIVMELLEGEDLRTRLKRMGRLPLDEVATIVLQAAKALQKAEQAGIVHRDLKPANVFVARVDDEEVVKVLDFGVAKQTGTDDKSHRTKSGVVLGSPPYMSPEQARGKKLDHRSDLWSLAAIAYRAACGRVPFSGDSDGDIIVKICTESAPPPSEHLPALDADVDAFFAKAFARDPADRFQSALELARAFRDVVGTSSVRPTLSEIREPVDSDAIAKSHDDTPRSAEDAVTTPLSLSGATDQLLNPLELSGAPSGAPPGAETAQTWIAAEPATHPNRRKLALWIGGTAAVALVVTVMASMSGDQPSQAGDGAALEATTPATPADASSADLGAANAAATQDPAPEDGTKDDPDVATKSAASADPAADAPSTRATSTRAVAPRPRPKRPTPKPAAKPGSDEPSWGY
jgi:serine/threonine-protein kinase